MLTRFGVEADGVKPREKNETHVPAALSDSGIDSNSSSSNHNNSVSSSGIEVDAASNVTASKPAAAASDTESNNTSTSSNSTTYISSDVSQSPQGQMFQNESSTAAPLSPESPAWKSAPNNTANPTLNETGIVNGNWDRVVEVRCSNVFVEQL